MNSEPSAVLLRFRQLTTRALSQLGFGADSFLLIAAILIGVVTAAAAVGFHELINLIRDLLYSEHVTVGRWTFAGFGGPQLYHHHAPMLLLILWPTIGGLAVGLLSQFVFRAREGHGIVDVIESVIRSSGFIKPISALEKILTSAITIGTGGAVGAEGPIVQIGAGIASGAGQLFGLPRQQMPVIVACGAAAGISAIFNSPMGGLLFSLEVILQDFSIRNVTPVVVASVVANVATAAIFRHFLPHHQFDSIFGLAQSPNMQLDWLQVWNFVILGIICGIIGVTLTRGMVFFERLFHQSRFPKFAKPAIGGGILGISGIIYVLFFGFFLRTEKPVAFETYPMPAFFGDGYGFIQTLLNHKFYSPNGGIFHLTHENWPLLALLLFLIVAKLFGTCVTLSSGGSGGVIAPALFLGAVAGGAMGMLMQAIHLFDPTRVYPEAYALVGMAAVLAAIVHAPLASIVILLELTRSPATVLPAMLATVTATGVARLIFRDSIYTLGLRQRGLTFGGAGVSLLHRLTVEQIELDPTVTLRPNEPFQNVIERMSASGANDLVVVDANSTYLGMVTADEIRIALMNHEAIPLLLVKDVARNDIPPVLTSDDLSKTLDAFARYELDHLPVAVPSSPTRVIGLVSRASLLRHYQQAIAGKT